MNKKRLFIVILVVFIISVLIYLASLQQEQVGNSGKIGVVVTVPPQAEFVNKVGGDKVEVMTMVPPGADPHSYEPLPKQLKQVSNARIYSEVGSGMEFELAWLDKIQSINPHLLMVNSSQGIQLIPNTAENEPGNDPHVWVSPKNAEIMVQNIYNSLVQIDPANQDYYAKNRDQYLQELDELDKNITESLKGKENTTIMVYHPAWGYFCKDYHLQQIPIESGGKEPTPQELASLMDLAKKENIKVIFVEPQYNPQNAEVIASQIGGQVVVVDDLAPNYLENMKKVAEAFSKV
jgi:zinc transport system substrate-binding protein